MKTINKDYELRRNFRDDTDLKVTGITYICAEEFPDWSFPLHAHEDAVELSLILNGRGNIYYGGKTRKIKKAVSGVCRKNYPRNILLPMSYCPVVETGSYFAFMKELFSYIMKIYEERPIGFEAALQDTCRALLSAIELLLPEDREENETVENFPVIKDVVDYLNSHYAEQISLEELAHRFYFSPYYLARRFKDETGYTINQYIINRRMGEAEKMLLYKKYSISETAKRTGYDNLQYFYKTFKKYTGCTPNEFRQLYNR